MIEAYCEVKAGYKFWKEQYNQITDLGFDEQDDEYIHHSDMMHKYLEALINEISEVKYELLDSVNDSFSKIIAIIDTIIALHQQDDDKLYFLSNTDRAIDVLLSCLNEIFRFTTKQQRLKDSILTYHQSKDYSNNLIKNLIDKCGWETVFANLINLEYSEILCINYQTEEYQFIIYDDRFKAFNDIKNNILDIEANTGLFTDYNGDINQIIDKYWDKIDFDYDSYYNKVYNIKGDD